LNLFNTKQRLRRIDKYPCFSVYGNRCRP